MYPYIPIGSMFGVYIYIFIYIYCKYTICSWNPKQPVLNECLVKHHFFISHDLETSNWTIPINMKEAWQFFLTFLGWPFQKLSCLQPRKQKGNFESPGVFIHTGTEQVFVLPFKLYYISTPKIMVALRNDPFLWGKRPYVLLGYVVGVASSQDSSGKSRFFGIPYWTCNNPGGHCHWEGGHTQSIW